MRPAVIGDEVVHRCLGCGFMTRTPTEKALDAFVGQTDAFGGALRVVLYSDGSGLGMLDAPLGLAS